MKSTEEVFDIYISMKNECAMDDLMSTTAYVRIPCLHFRYAHDIVTLLNMTRSKSWTFAAKFEDKSTRHQLESKAKAVTAWAWSFQGEPAPTNNTKEITDYHVLEHALAEKSFQERLNDMNKAPQFSKDNLTRQKAAVTWQNELNQVAGLQTYQLGDLIKSATELHEVLHKVAVNIMQNLAHLRCFKGIFEMPGDDHLMQVNMHDTFLTLDDDFPLAIKNIEHEGKIMKEFYYKKDQGDDKHEQAGIMAVKYMVCQGGTDVLFMNCGVILTGCVSGIVSENQKRVIISLLKKHISQESFINFQQEALAGAQSQPVFLVGAK